MKIIFLRTPCKQIDYSINGRLKPVCKFAWERTQNFSFALRANRLAFNFGLVKVAKVSREIGEIISRRGTARKKLDYSINGWLEPACKFALGKTQNYSFALRANRLAPDWCLITSEEGACALRKNASSSG